MAFKTKTSTVVTGGTTTATAPTGLSVGDDIWAICTNDGSGGTASATGWATKFSISLNAGDTQSIEILRLTGGYTGSAPSYAFTTSGNSGAIDLVVFSGRDLSAAVLSGTPASSTAANNSVVSIAAGGFTAAGGEDLFLVTCLDVASGSDTWNDAPPGALTERDETQGSFYHIEVATQDNLSAGATGTITSTATITSGAGATGYYSIAIGIPASGAVAVTSPPLLAAPRRGAGGAPLRLPPMPIPWSFVIVNPAAVVDVAPFPFAASSVTALVLRTSPPLPLPALRGPDRKPLRWQALPTPAYPPTTIVNPAAIVDVASFPFAASSVSTPVARASVSITTASFPFAASSVAAAAVRAAAVVTVASFPFAASSVSTHVARASVSITTASFPFAASSVAAAAVRAAAVVTVASFPFAASSVSTHVARASVSITTASFPFAASSVAAAAVRAAAVVTVASFPFAASSVDAIVARLYARMPVPARRGADARAYRPVPMPVAAITGISAVVATASFPFAASSVGASVARATVSITTASFPFAASSVGASVARATVSITTASFPFAAPSVSIHVARASAVVAQASFPFAAPSVSIHVARASVSVATASFSFTAPSVAAAAVRAAAVATAASFPFTASSVVAVVVRGPLDLTAHALAELTLVLESSAVLRVLVEPSLAADLALVVDTSVHLYVLVE